jgi:hypothetical protein
MPHLNVRSGARSRTTASVVVGLSLFLAACGASPFAPSNLPVPDLQAAPLSVTVDGVSVSVTAYAWRDFMPTTTSPDHSLSVSLTLHVADGAALPSDLTVDASWALNGSTVWVGPSLSEGAFQRDPTMRGGPAWDIGSTVTAVLRLRDGRGNTYLLRAHDCPVVMAQ